MTAATADPVNSPSHYIGAGGLEAIDIIEAVSGLAMHLPTALVYILRHQRKGRPSEDLRKARWYVRRVLAVDVLPLPHQVVQLQLTEGGADAFALQGPARWAFHAISDAIEPGEYWRRRRRLALAGECLDAAIAAIDPEP